MAQGRVKLTGDAGDPQSAKRARQGGSEQTGRFLREQSVAASSCQRRTGGGTRSKRMAFYVS